MALTGTGIQIGSATQFGASIRYPRGLASDGTTVILFDANNGYTLNPTTGAAVKIGTLSSFDVSESQLRSACWNGTNFVFYGNSRRRLYTYDPDDGSVTDLTGELSIQGSATNPDVWGLAFLDGMYWALERQTDALYNIVGNELVQVGTANNYGLTGSPNIQAFTSYRAELIAASNGLDQLVRFNKTTGVATAIADSTLPDGSPEALVEHDGKLLMAGSATDALFRLYDVRWDETIDTIEVDEGGNGSRDLSTVSQDATGFEFAPNNTARSWLTISGMDLTITNAPDVTADTDYDVVVRAVRGSVHEDKTLIVQVIAAVAPPPPEDAVLDITVSPNSVTAGGIATVSFTFSKSVRNFTDAKVNVSTGATKGTLTDEGNNIWTMPVTAPSAGSGTVTVSVAEDVVSPGNNADSVQFAYTAPPPMLTVPGAPTGLTVDSATSNSLTISFTAGANGGAEITGHEVNVAEGTSPGTTWTPTGSTNTTHRVSNLKPNTQYTVQVRSRNSEGASHPSNSVTERTDAQIARVRAVPTHPTAPLQVNVELTPTTAKISWKTPTNGASLTGYEISYAEGATPGTTWIPTGSTRTRFFVKGLKRSTQYTWQVRGVTDSGTGTASRALTERTPIASLDNAIFFKECVNYFDQGARVSEYGNPSNVIRAVGDNDYRTFSREKDLVLDISVNGNPTRVDAVCVKGIGIEGHSAEPMGGTGVGYSNRMMPETVQNFEGTAVSTTVFGLQHDLYLLDQHFTATNVRMTFTGTDAKITEIMLLTFLLELDANGDFTEISPDYIDRSGVIHTGPDGGIRRSSPLGAERPKWETNYTVKIVPRKTLFESVDEFVYQMGENPNIVHAQEWTRYPARIHPASFLLTRVPTRLRGDDKLLGDVVQFRVGEQ